MDGPADEAVLGRWYYGAVDEDTTPEADQEAAATRYELHEDTDPIPVRIDLDELESLRWQAAARAAGISGEHDRVAAADGPAIDNRGVDADVYCVVLSGRPEDP